MKIDFRKRYCEASGIYRICTTIVVLDNAMTITLKDTYDRSTKKHDQWIFIDEWFWHRESQPQDINHISDKSIIKLAEQWSKDNTEFRGIAFDHP